MIQVPCLVLLEREITTLQPIHYPPNHLPKALSQSMLSSPQEPSFVLKVPHGYSVTFPNSNTKLLNNHEALLKQKKALAEKRA
jgi:hypothetical protein